MTQKKISKRWDLYSKKELLIKALKCSSITEKPVDLSFQDDLSNLLHAIEFYEPTLTKSSCPLIAVDLACNSYIRLSYVKATLTSATLGSSLVGAVSFRTADNTLHFLPTIKSASLEFENLLRPMIRLQGVYEDLAKITLTRSYSFPSNGESLSCKVNLSFEALRQIDLAEDFLRGDAFRFCTISSMYTPGVYDGNIIQYRHTGGELLDFQLDSRTKRGHYLFKRNPSLIEGFTLWKDKNSKGKIGTPGSHDSPSIMIRSETKGLELGIQGYLADTLNVNDDSLSVWLEWQNAPRSINAGQIVKFNYVAKALPPRE